MPTVHEKILSCSYEELPESVVSSLVSPPILSGLAEVDGNGFRLIDPKPLHKSAEQALVPKLGIKSWRYSGRLGVIYQNVTIDVVLELLLSNPTGARIKIH